MFGIQLFSHSLPLFNSIILFRSDWKVSLLTQTPVCASHLTAYLLDSIEFLIQALVEMNEKRKGGQRARGSICLEEESEEYNKGLQETGFKSKGRKGHIRNVSVEEGSFDPSHLHPGAGARVVDIHRPFFDEWVCRFVPCSIRVQGAYIVTNRLQVRLVRFRG